MYWIEIPNSVTPTSIIPFEDDKIFTISSSVIIGKPTYTDTFLRKTDFYYGEDLWALKIPWIDCDSSSTNSEIYYDKDDGTIYNFLAIESQIYYFTIDEENGNVTSKYIWSDFDKCEKIYRIQKQINLIYLIFGCKGYTAVTIYNPEENVFVESYSGGKDLYAISFTPFQAFIAYSKDINKPLLDIKRGPKESLNWLYDFKLGIENDESQL